MPDDQRGGAAVREQVDPVAGWGPGRSGRSAPPGPWSANTSTEDVSTRMRRCSWPWSQRQRGALHAGEGRVEADVAGLGAVDVHLVRWSCRSRSGCCWPLPTWTLTPNCVAVPGAKIPSRSSVAPLMPADVVPVIAFVGERSWARRCSSVVQFGHRLLRSAAPCRRSCPAPVRAGCCSRCATASVGMLPA